MSQFFYMKPARVLNFDEERLSEYLKQKYSGLQLFENEIDEQADFSFRIEEKKDRSERGNVR